MLPEVQTIVDYLARTFKCELFYNEKDAVVGVYIVTPEGAIPVVISRKISYYMTQKGEMCGTPPELAPPLSTEEALASQQLVSDRVFRGGTPVEVRQDTKPVV